MPRRGPARLTSLAAFFVLMPAVSLTACGGGEDPSTTPTTGTSESTSTTPDPSTSTPAPEDDSLAIALTRKGDEFTPDGERVDAAIDQPIVLTITSDESGELHVHTVPEQEIAYDAGTSQHEIVIDRPGVVEIESHAPDVIVLQLEVR